MQCDAKHDRRHLTGTGSRTCASFWCAAYRSDHPHWAIFIDFFFTVIPSLASSGPEVGGALHLQTYGWYPAPSPLDGSARWRHLSDRGAGVWSRCGRPGWLIWIGGAEMHERTA
jgi:hypothetical protein